VAGNAPLSVTLANALAIKALHGFETPVYAGCDRPLAQAQVTAQDVLGADGMETTGPRLPGQSTTPAGAGPRRAGDDRLRARPPGPHHAAGGGAADQRGHRVRAGARPARAAEGLVIMGGSTTVGGNATAAAEFNIHADPEAAARVFDCGVPVVMFGLNVCRQLPIGQPQVDRLRRHRQCQGRGLRRLCRRLRRHRPPARARGAVAVRPGAGDLAGAARTVRSAAGARGRRAAGRFTRGMTVCDLRAPALARANAQRGGAGRGRGGAGMGDAAPGATAGPLISGAG
jgi:purine nucleosidase